TTVAQPFEEVAAWAVRAIEGQIAGRDVPACTHVAGRLVRRQSCGCGYEAYRRDSQAIPVMDMNGSPAALGPGAMIGRLDVLRPVLAGLLGTGSTSSAAAARLLDGLR